MRRGSVQIVVTFAIVLWAVAWIVVSVSCEQRARAYMHAAGDYYFKANGVDVPKLTPQRSDAYAAMSSRSDDKMARSARTAAAAFVIGVTPAGLALVLASYRLGRRRRRKAVPATP